MKRDIFFVAIAMMHATSGIAQGDSAKYHDIEEVVVMSVRASNSAPSAHSNVEQQAIAASNYGQDIPYLLSLTPSAVATSDAGAGVGYTALRIRGSDAQRINFTINGVPLNDAESHSVFWVNMPDFASSLHNVQVQRGVGASTNGAAAFGASVNMQTETLNPAPYGEYSGSVGSFATLKNTIKAGSGLIKDKFAVDARLSDIRSDGYIDRASSSLQSYYFAAGYYGGKRMLKILTFAGQEKTYQAWDGVPEEMLAMRRTYNPCGFMGKDENGVEQYYDNQTDNYRQMHYQLIYAEQVNARWNFHAALHYTYGGGYYEDYKTNAKTKEYLLAGIEGRHDLVRQKWLRNHFYGGTYSLNYVKNGIKLTLGGAASYYDGDHYGKVIWVKDAGDLNHPYYDNTGRKLDANVFVKLNYHLWRGLHAYGDAQFRYIDYRIDGSDDKYDSEKNSAIALAVRQDYPFFNPKAGLYYVLNSVNEVYLSLGISHREPSRANFTEASESERPTYETLYDWEAGWRYRGERLRAGLGAYLMNYDNQLVRTGKISEIGKELTSNIERSRRAGIELEASARIGSWLRWDGNLALSVNEIYGFVEYVDDWDNGGQRRVAWGRRDIAFSPNMALNSALAYDYNGFAASLRSQWVGRQFIDNTSSLERSIGAYFVNSIAIGYRFKLRRAAISVELLCNNVFNTLYESNAWVYSYYENRQRKHEAGYFPQAGRHFVGRVGVRF